MDSATDLLHKRSRRAAEIALSLSALFFVSVGGIYVVSKLIAFLQPILVPFAVAGVLAYLLEPVVSRLMRRGMTRRAAVIFVFSVFFGSVTILGFWLLPRVATQTDRIVKKTPEYAIKTQQKIFQAVDVVENKFGIEVLPKTPRIQRWRREVGKASKWAMESSTNAVVEATRDAALVMEDARSQLDEILAKKGNVREDLENLISRLRMIDQQEGLPVGQVVASGDGTPSEEGAHDIFTQGPPQPVSPMEPSLQEFDYDMREFLRGDWARSAMSSIWEFFRNSFGGFLGVFGILVSMVIVPLYLYYFLLEAPSIKASWSDYLPLRASAFKGEVVECANEINGYLIAFFRGQLLVSLINGVATGFLLVFIGLEFGALIGLLLCVLGLIPFLGILLCWLPAVLIAIAQGGSWIAPDSPWWVLPLVVTCIFILIQQIDGFFISPKVIGDSVGLHPMTVIASLFAWSLVLGGLFGAILAIPLTASLKVIFRKYLWQKRPSSPDFEGSADDDSAHGDQVVEAGPSDAFVTP